MFSALPKTAEAAGIPYIYKKTDSALRGNIGCELNAVMDASGEACLIFAPAFPQMGRVTRRGIHYIDGVPVADSVFGKDPFEPVTESSVREIVRKQSDREDCLSFKRAGVPSFYCRHSHF